MSANASSTFPPTTPSPLQSATPTSQRVITTTITSGSASPTQAASSKSTVPIAPIVGGAVGGAFLAVAAVLIWKWWGWCIKRQGEKDRKEALERKKLRQNTRRNTSSGAFAGNQPPAAMSHTGKKVSFISRTPSPRPSKKEAKTAARAAAKKAVKTPEADALSRPRRASGPRPIRPSPLSQSISKSPTPSTPSSSSPIPPSPSRTAKAAKRELAEPDSPSVRPFLSRPLMAQRPSTMTSDSVYSTESGEEHQNRVSASLIMAALEHLDIRRSIANYLPLGSGRNNGMAHSRLSHMSTGSADEQEDIDEPEDAIGVAYGGEDQGPSADNMV
ncbi:predicted protein [Sparassis crispa]|uniref:Uncharacterized protein n=1 Tax=Sparassis crispa TaxID=139825 RepID=A0A401GK73_9APHY|nr:predicted protein [Sparassis crispa]GBE82568.1 predicted protein [Sparassis crispa]